MTDRTPSSTDQATLDRLTRVTVALTRLGEVVVAQEAGQDAPLPLDDLQVLDQDLVQPLLSSPSGWLNEVCQAVMVDEVPDHAMHALRWLLDRALLRVEHEGSTWSLHALVGRLQRRPGEPLPVVLDGVIDQADALSTALTGETGRVRCAVQYFTSSSVFPYPEINLWTTALSSLGMPLIDRTDLPTYNALGMDEPNASDDTPMDATYAMLLVALRIDGLEADTVTRMFGAGTVGPRLTLPYRVGPLTRTVDLLEPRLVPVFTAQAMLSCRDDVEHLMAFADVQHDRLGKSWDGVVAFLYPTHTLPDGSDDNAMDVHHLQRVSVVLWAERLGMLVAGYTTRALPGPAVMRLLGSFSAHLEHRGVPQVHFLPPQAEEVMDGGEDGRRRYLTPVGVQVAPV